MIYITRESKIYEGVGVSYNNLSYTQTFITWFTMHYWHFIYFDTK